MEKQKAIIQSPEYKKQVLALKNPADIEKPVKKRKLPKAHPVQVKKTTPEVILMLDSHEKIILSMLLGINGVPLTTQQIADHMKWPKPATERFIKLIFKKIKKLVKIPQNRDLSEARIQELKVELSSIKVK